ncbi:VOC family protein [Trabulsiella odontotermitis]|uniref:VOC family protein n=1 Tax=Trabulsiella odontotermitis TaxID=379893 RepID=UPI000675F9A6|nr:VOC family protein [Trabulsiella odontotermitis]
MKIAHVALWTRNLDAQAAFWQTFFGGKANEKYQSRNNPGFESYFITLDEGPTIELMTLPTLADAPDNNVMTGWAHVHGVADAVPEVILTRRRTSNPDLPVRSARPQTPGFAAPRPARSG